MHSKTTILSDADFESIKAACRNRFNWTDGGHWNGRGPAPNCATSRAKRQTSSLTIQWPDQSSADRWNHDIARAERAKGYGIGLLASLVAAWLPVSRALRGTPASFRDFAITVAIGERLAASEPVQANEKGQDHDCNGVLRAGQPFGPAAFHRQNNNGVV